MTQREYITTCNIQHTLAALHHLHQILPRWGVGEKELEEILKPMSLLLNRLHTGITVKGD